MGARRDEKKNNRGAYVFSLEAQAARDEARVLVEEARKIRDEILGPRTPVEAKAVEAPAAPVSAAEPAPVEAPKEPEATPPQGA